MTHWIWQHRKWPEFTWQAEKIQPLLSKARLTQGKLLGLMQSFDQSTQEQSNIQAMTNEMITTSAIEGAVLDRDSVRSSIHHRLGIDNGGFKGQPDRYVEGLLDILLDATERYEESLKIERLYPWHAALFPTGYSGLTKILVGQLRGEGEMKIISGRGHKITIHYIAPPANELKREMKLFLSWFNGASRKVDQLDGIVRAAIAHLWFEKLHPFDDGNGRIGRAIIELALAQDEKLATRFYSISSAIMEQRKGYYQILDLVSKGGMDITAWLAWFLNCFTQAIESSLQHIQISLEKSRFWQIHAETPLNPRQKKVLHKMLDQGIGGYEGGMTTRKYMGIAKVSRATAFRELSDLVEKNCLKAMDKKGRSSAYEIIWPS